MTTATTQSTTFENRRDRTPDNWASRLWVASSPVTFFRRLAQNRFDIDRRFWKWLPLLTFMSMEFSFWSTMQRRFLGRKVDRVNLGSDPVIVLGHWRCGTTLLHDLLTLDRRHVFPTTYECLAPTHFLLTERAAMRWFSRLVPKKRPMDNMRLGWDRPDEDEFALVSMGLPSPYLTLAFPNRPPQHHEYLEVEQVPPAERERWKREFARFLKGVVYLRPGRLVLKSPTHTWRIRILLEMFPDARFVHIVRDPYVVFSSTMHLWKSIYRLHALQRPTFAGLEDHVFETFLDMHRVLDATRSLVSADRFHELKYEDLVADPLECARAIYEHLELGDFNAVIPAIENYFAEVGDYQTNRYELSAQQRAEITRRWGDVIRRYGYASA